MRRRGPGPLRRIMFEIHSRPDATPRLLKMESINEAVLTRHLEMLPSEGLID